MTTATERTTIALGHSLVGFGKLISDHIHATGHEVRWGFWDARCCDCGWRVDLSFKGEPFDPSVLCDWFATVQADRT